MKLGSQHRGGQFRSLHFPTIFISSPPCNWLLWLGTMTRDWLERCNGWFSDLGCLTWFVSGFPMPSVKADTQILALLCRVHHTFFRDTPTTINLGGLCTAQLCPQVHTHHWCPLPYRQAACGQGSCQAALPSPESPRPVGTVPHWHPTSPGAAGITLPPSLLWLYHCPVSPASFLSSDFSSQNGGNRL